MTPEECTTWAGHMGIELDARNLPTNGTPPGWHATTVRVPQDFPKVYWFARHVEQALQPRSACLMWVTGWSVWPSSENLHMYYRLRESYGDRRHLHEAPGHYFLDYESADLQTFLHMALLFGWDAQLFPVSGFARAILSSTEHVDYFAQPKCGDLARQFEAPLLPGGTATPPESSRHPLE